MSGKGVPGALSVEVAVQDPRGAAVAGEAGADRVELCTALALTGGLTPSIGLLEATVEVGLPVHALIRTRPGGFVYDAEEIAVQARDLRAAVEAGAAGVVIGALTAQRELDVESLRHLIDAAAGTEVTFHRAFDVVTDWRRTLETLASLGVRRVLTSGGAARAVDGVGQLRELAAQRTGVQVMAGGGVQIEHVQSLREAEVDAVHLSARRSTPDPGPVGPGGGAAGVRDHTDAQTVRQAVHAAHLTPFPNKP